MKNITTKIQHLIKERNISLSNLSVLHSTFRCIEKVLEKQDKSRENKIKTKSKERYHNFNFTLL